LRPNGSGSSTHFCVSWYMHASIESDKEPLTHSDAVLYVANTLQEKRIIYRRSKSAIPA
jgi:hypothetical protein